MCLTIPAKIISVNNGIAFVEDFREQQKQINISNLPHAKENDWILIGADIGIRKISEIEAEELIRLFNRIEP